MGTSVREIQEGWIKYAMTLSVAYDIQFMEVLKLNVFTAKFMMKQIPIRNELKG
jgi:hypothetical protein